jgi:anti-sigma factor RsiW
MNHELELKIQAWVDGELSDLEATRIADLVASDAEAGAIAAELGTLRTAMTGGELALTVPETREFYWNKIERGIQREATFAPSRPGDSWAARWRRFLLPLGGVAALACMFVMSVQQAQKPTFDEISATDQGMEAVTFHDQSDGMTVIWLQDSSQTSDASKSAPGDASSDIETD